MEPIMPLDLQQIYSRRQQKERIELVASILQTSGVALLAFLVSLILLIASLKYGSVPGPVALL
jgi:hypothetical protein